jgi:ABC-type branched-subunit amino acid transport system ATPase component
LCADWFKAMAAIRGTVVGILLVEQNARQSLALADRA